MQKGDWVVNYENRSDWTDDGRYPTREAAIVGGKAAALEWGAETYETGQIDPHEPMPPDADDIIQHLSEAAAGECGSEHTEDWLMHVPKEAEQELTDQVYDVVMAWLKKHNLMPRFFLVTEVQTHQVGEDPDQDRVFDNCNVCGRKLHTDDEDKMGMCSMCASE